MCSKSYQKQEVKGALTKRLHHAWRILTVKGVGEAGGGRLSESVEKENSS